MKSFISTIILAVTFLALPAVLNAQSGAESLNYSVLELHSKGVKYQSNTLTFLAPPSGSTIGVVAWAWAFTTTTPSGTVVMLCYANSNPAKCFDVSELPQGNSTHWMGLPAYGSEFYMTFEVSGSGYLAPPIYTSNQTQTTVNYAD